ncbi:MAG TPA: glycosyltransferase family 4 protein [Rhizomicrobium sp.]|jgi:glycosyltransferase involved in cell wall biosynthesis
MPSGPLSILHVDLSKHFGGAERYCLDLAGRQAACGHKVGVVIWGQKARDSYRHHAAPGVTLYWAPCIFASRTVARAIAAQKADILHVHLPDAARAVAAARRHPPVAMTLHIRYRQKEMGGVDGLIRIADWQERESAGFAGPAITVPNWVPDEAPFDPVRVAALRTGVGAGLFLVGAVARLNRIKRQDLLIDAWRRAALSGARLLLIGEGPDRAALEARAAGDPTILFLGHRDDTQDWYRALDLFVLASDWEGMPLSVLEAMRAGAPILATASAGTAEVLRDSTAQLVPCGDTAALADALVQAHADFQAGRPRRAVYDMTRFDAGHAVSRIEDFYRRIIAARGPSVAGTKA